MYIWLILGSGFIFGTLLGSFTKVLADRSVGNVSLMGRSQCESCKHTLSYYDLFPILSFLFNEGKCHYCHKNLSLEYPAVEILTGVLIATLYYLFLPLSSFNLPILNLLLLLLELLFKSFVVVVLMAVLITDLKKGLIPDRISYPAIIISFFFLLFLVCLKVYMVYFSLLNSKIGMYLLPPNSDYFIRHTDDVVFPFFQSILTGFGIGLFFLTLILLTKGRGMGGGDMKLGVFIGLVLGFPLAVISLMLGFLSGAIMGIILLVFGKKRFGQTIPFGPFLSLGAILTLFWGDKILSWYINLRLN